MVKHWSPSLESPEKQRTAKRQILSPFQFRKMETEELDAVLERIWDLHDKLSDAIHSISRSHFLLSTKSLNPKKKPPQQDAASAPPPHQHGFVFVKELDNNNTVFALQSAVQEAKSLNAIRTALENLEDQLEFLRTIQTQQRAERDAAIARLEQSRIVLAMRLAEHQGKKYKVIEEALAFVGDVQDASHFVFLENLYGRPGRPSDENLIGQGGSKSSPVLKVLISSFNLLKNSLAADHLGGLLGNAAVFAISMMALLRLHQVAYTGHPYESEAVGYDNRNTRKVSQSDGSSSNGNLNHLDVMLARG